MAMLRGTTAGLPVRSRGRFLAALLLLVGALVNCSCSSAEPTPQAKKPSEEKKPAAAKPADENKAPPKTDAKTPDDESGATRFDSKLRLMVYQLVEPDEGPFWNSPPNQSRLFDYRFLGITPTRGGKGIRIPRGARWAVYAPRPRYTREELAALRQLKKRSRGLKGVDVLGTAAYQLPAKVFERVAREIKVKQIPGLLVGRYQASDKQLELLRGAVHLKTLVISGIGVAPRRLSWLRSLRDLENLVIHDNRPGSTPVPPLLLKDLSSLKNLQRLSLFEINIAHAPFLKQLANCPDLTTLIVHSMAGDCTPATMSSLKSLRNLERLYLRGEYATHEDLTNLAKLPRLRNLALIGRTRWSPQLLQTLESFPALARIRLGREREGQVQLEDLTRLKHLEVLRSFRIGELSPTNARLLQRFPNLTTLEASIANVDDAEPVLKMISLCPHLEDLSVYWEGNGVLDLSSLRGLRKLRRLCVNFPDVNDKVRLKGLGGLPQLEDLALRNSSATKESTRQLRNLRRLRRLTLDFSTTPTVAMINDVGQLENLRRLTINPSPYFDGKRMIARFELLRGLKKLEFLDVVTAKISRDELSHLAALPALKTLVLDRTHTTTSSLKQLRKMRALETLVLGDFGANEQAVHAALTDTELDRVLIETNRIGYGFVYGPDRWKLGSPSVGTPYAVQHLLTNHDIPNPFFPRSFLRRWPTYMVAW